MPRILLTPVLAPLVRQRVVGAVLLAMIALQALFTALGLPFYRCPTFALLGVPCPGCGLTRAVVALLHLDFQGMAALHAFAPLALLGGLTVVGAALSPAPWRERLAALVERLESKTGIMVWLLLGFVLYWLARLCFYRPLLLTALTSS